MGKGDMARMYKYMSAEDQRTFDRWLKANTIISLIFATGLIAMAFAGSTSVGLREEAVAANASGDCTVSSCLEKVQVDHQSSSAITSANGSRMTSMATKCPAARGANAATTSRRPRPIKPAETARGHPIPGLTP